MKFLSNKFIKIISISKIKSLKYIILLSLIVYNIWFINYYIKTDYNPISFFKIMSKFSGFLSKLYVPIIFREFLFKNYSNFYNVNKDDIKKNWRDFKNFNEFFTREVKERNFKKSKEYILCPSDSQILEISEVIENKVLLIKDKKYNLGELLFGNKNIEFDKKKINEIKRNKKNKLYSVIFYLNPGDYHRFHSPTDFKIKNIIHIPGNLYPVKISFIKRFSNVYEKNERISIFGESSNGFLALIAVGALNVGSIDLTFDSNIKTNLFNYSNNKLGYFNYKNYKKLNKGNELGKFNLGSTIVMIFEAPNFKFLKKSFDKVRYGDILGKLKK